MPIDRYFTTPCVVRNPSPDLSDSTVDADGVPLVSVATVATSCHVQPYRATDAEQVLGRELAKRARRAWFPAGTAIGFASSVEIDGETFDVWGDPDDWNLGSANDHVAVILVRPVVNAASGGSS
jgi:hypothetical protein